MHAHEDFPIDHCNVKSKKYGSEPIGNHEVQESEGGEADLHKHRKRCKKNPGHAQFIPVDEFTKEHLQEGHRDNDVYELIKATADLTVRVDVMLTSKHRRKICPNKLKLYALRNRSTESLQTGSGMIWEVGRLESQDKAHNGKHSKRSKCSCRKCEHSDTPSDVWWEFYVDTAAHVVFDDTGANHTKLKLFYDREDSQVVILDKVSVVQASIGYDYCMLKSATCDTSLGEKLEKMWNKFSKIWHVVWKKYNESRDVDKLAFIVSHPHGCTKQVSVGHWKDKNKVQNTEGTELYTFTYIIPTCKGCSGANVQCLGYSVDLPDLVHSGWLTTKLNFSGACNAF